MKRKKRRMKRKKRAFFKRKYNKSQIVKIRLFDFAPSPKMPPANQWLTELLDKYGI